MAIATKCNLVPNVTYRRWDARAVGDNPDWREKFDKVVCFFVLHWVPGEMKAIQGILKCLKPAGEALFIIDNQDDDFNLFQATSFLKGHAKWDPYVKVYGFKKLVSILCVTFGLFPALLHLPNIVTVHFLTRSDVIGYFENF